MKQKVLIGTFLIFTLLSCSSKSEKQSDNNSSTQSSSSSNDDNSFQSSSSYYSNEEDNEESNEENNEYSNGCKFEDGTYSATVDYNNPETGYSATYTLDVEVQDCQIVQINFPNDGYLDEDHISYADIDEDGNATVDGEDGKTYEIQIDN
jgi:hypothetical protein